MKNYILFHINEELFDLYKEMVQGKRVAFMAEPNNSPYCALINFGIFKLDVEWPPFGYLARITLSPFAPRTSGFNEKGQCYLKVEIDG